MGSYQTVQLLQSRNVRKRFLPIACGHTVLPSLDSVTLLPRRQKRFAFDNVSAMDDATRTPDEVDRSLR
jgi:hypothetical protein